MKTPGYWKNKGFYARLLLPVGMLYSAATAFRFKLKRPRKVPVPVICIGNLTAGGTGKTPTAAEIANLLTSRCCWQGKRRSASTPIVSRPRKKR